MKKDVDNASTGNIKLDKSQKKVIGKLIDELIKSQQRSDKIAFITVVIFIFNIILLAYLLGKALS